MKSVPYVPDPRKFINMFKSSKLDPSLEALPVQTGGSPTVFNTTEAVTHIDLQVKRRPRASSIKTISKPRKTNSTTDRRGKQTTSKRKTVKRLATKSTKKKNPSKSKPAKKRKSPKTQNKRNTVFD